MDLSNMKMPDWLVGGGTLAFLIAMFLPWYKAEAFGFSTSASGWDYFLMGIVPLILFIAVTVILVAPKLVDTMNVPEEFGPMPKAQAALIAAGIGLALVLLRLLIKDDGGVEEAGDFIDRAYGLFLAFLAAVAVTAGAFLKFQGKDEEAGAGPAQPPTPF